MKLYESVWNSCLTVFHGGISAKEWAMDTLWMSYESEVNGDGMGARIHLMALMGLG